MRLTACQAAVAFSCRTTSSISSSYIAFCGEFRKRRPLVVRSLWLAAASPLGPKVRQSGVVTVVVTPRRFGRLPAITFQVLIELCSFVLRPFARNAFLFVRSSMATMASADSPRSLSTPGSPRVSVCSFRSRLWALQKVVSDSWASRVLACSPPTSCLTAHLCSFGRTFAFHPFAPPPCGDSLAVRLRLASQAPVGNLSSR